MSIKTFLWLTFVLSATCLRAETISIVVASNAAQRVQFGAEKLAQALKVEKIDAKVTQSGTGPERRIHLETPYDAGAGHEGFRFALMGNNDVVITAGDDSGMLYGCLELAKRIQAAGKLPVAELANYSDKPAMTLRGTCIGMQKTFLLPGRKVYEYPYTPELFPWFYDKALWTEYLDFLVANRMNTLYLWSGHPFASLVRLKDYPYAVEVSDTVFAQNQEQFRWLAQECDKRGIWLVQMFYNILVSKPFAETNGIATQLSAPTPLVADYTRKSIAEFVKDYPNVGLMLCLGEALQGTDNQIEWATKTILPGVLDGMKEAGLKEQPPVVIRTHAMNPEAIMPACFQVYSNLFTETKYNGESLTTYEPRGKDAATHLAMAKLGPHLVNIHIMSNLEPFRYGATEFIRKSVLASRDRLGASGVHLYPLSYWNWPYSPDIAETPLLQWNRDWIWFEAWSRYSWNPDVPAAEDYAYWVGRLADFYGNTNAAEKILAAYNEAGEVAPMLIRRFGITEGNRQTLSLGMTLDQLVNPMRYGAIEDLWLSQAPPGERLDEFVKREWNHEAHEGETPESIITDVLNYSSNAVVTIDSAEKLVTKNREEFERLRNDLHCVQALAKNYSDKAHAAEFVLRYGYSHDIHDMGTANTFLTQSLADYKDLVGLTEKTYQFANSMQTGQRKIPAPGGGNGQRANYLWAQLVPRYEKELKDFQTNLVQSAQDTNTPVAQIAPQVQAWPAAAFKLISTNAEAYTVTNGAKVFTDRGYKIAALAPELNGLTGLRISHDAAKSGNYTPVEFETTEPVVVLVGYFDDKRDMWLQVPNLDVAAQADERGGVDVLLRNAAMIQQCPLVDVHAFRYGAGRNKLELIGKGSFVVLGIVPQSAKLDKRDANVH